MEGIKILETTPIFAIRTWVFWLLAAATLCFVIIIFICGRMEEKTPENFKKRGVYFIYGISFILFICLALFFYEVQYNAVPTGEYKYKIEIKQDTNIQDLLNRYSIIEVDPYHEWLLIKERKHER